MAEMPVCVSVAPFTGAWIEIATVTLDSSLDLGRTLHGCVD